MSIELNISKKSFPKKHTEEEVSWAKDVIKKLPKVSQSNIVGQKILEEYQLKFNKQISVAGMYTWLRLEENPELKDLKRERAKLYHRRFYAKKTGKNMESNARYVREKETFEKSNFLAYINHNILGYESEEELKKFLIQSKVIGEDIHIFKRTPVKIDYTIKIGE